MTSKNPVNPWTPQDEKEHFPSLLEWWCAQAFFKTVEDNKKWSYKVTFTEWFEKPKVGSILHTSLFDLDNNKQFSYYSRNNSNKLESAKDIFDVSYEDSFMKGSYPDYKIYFNDKKNDIKLHMNYHAEALPHWVAQQITGGWLPMGLGSYRYGFIPKCDLSGTMNIKDKTFKIAGEGYFEHVWGDFLYDNPISNVPELKKTISTYSKLAGWWLLNRKIRIPNSIIFSTENNPFGYDWAWALLDNGWTLFYGNILFWLMGGPVVGTLILSKDGKKYTEFYNLNFNYKKTRTSDKYDFVYPSDLEVTGTKGKEKIHLRFKMTTDTREYIARFPKEKYWKGFIICEAPGIVEGYYSDGINTTKLTGVCKMEPQRQVSKFGHNSLKITFLKPPEGVGISFDLRSHYFMKKVFTCIQLAPRPKIKFSFERIDNI